MTTRSAARLVRKTFPLEAIYTVINGFCVSIPNKALSNNLEINREPKIDHHYDGASTPCPFCHNLFARM